MQKSKTVFLSITHGWHARLLLQTDFITTLNNDEIKVVILSPNADEPYFMQEYGKNSILEKIYPEKRMLYNLTDFLRRNLVLRGKKTFTVEARIKRLKKSSRKRYYIIRIFEALVKTFPIISKLLINLDLFFFQDRQYISLFKKYNPDHLIVCSTVHQMAHFLLKRARKERIPITFIVESWDNPTAKVNFSIQPERFIVWNDINKMELIEYFKFSEHSIDVTGSAYHDIYAHPEWVTKREIFFKTMGLDSDKRLIVIAGTLDNLYPDFEDFLLNLVKDVEKIGDCQILIRPHPQVISGYSKGKGLQILESYAARFKSVFFDLPEVVSETLPVYIHQNDIRHLADIIFHADVLISFLSTLTIDACSADTPVILVGFDGPKAETIGVSSQKRLQFNHLRRIVSREGAPVANNQDELIQFICNYLEKPDIHKNERAVIVNDQCYYLDGNSGKRMAEAVRRNLERVYPKSGYYVWN